MKVGISSPGSASAWIQSASDSAPSPALDSGTDVDPTPNSVEQQAAQAVTAMPDGGAVIDPSGGRDVQQCRLLANEIACQLVTIDTVQDFDPFCAVVEDGQAGISRAWIAEERQRWGGDDDPDRRNAG